MDTTRIKEISEIGKLLNKYAYNSGLDSIATFNDWIAWMCRKFDISNIFDKDGMTGVLRDAMAENRDYYEAMALWFEAYMNGYKLFGPWDTLGGIYEQNFQSSSKASNLGQFFTPESISNLCAEIVQNRIAGSDGVCVHSDPCCGSGRMIIGSYNKCNRFQRNFFHAGDIDMSSVNMCALNFMINGMVGIVERRDALSGKFYGGYIVNACKVPVYNDMCCLEWFDDEEHFSKRSRTTYEMVKSWNIVYFDPKRQTHDINHTARAEHSTSEIPKKEQQKKEAQQLTLF